MPLDDASVDVIISNCVINLSADKDAVLKYLDNKNPSKEEIQAGLQAFANLKASGDLSPDQIKELGKSMVSKSSATFMAQ